MPRSSFSMWLISRRMGSALKDVFTDQPHTLRLAERPGLYLRLGFYLSIFQSLCIYTWQPEPIVAKPIHTKKHTTQYKYYYTNKRKKRETKPLLERDICCRRSHLHFSTISSKRGKANLLNIIVTL